jgi:outer membrane biosynthesis protein TonB
METLKKIVTNQYFPAAAVLTAVLLFWTIAMFGGLSLLNNNQPPMATLTWMLFVYAAAVLTPLAGVLAGVDLVRRWRRNRMYALALKDGTVEYETAEYEAAQAESMQDEALEDQEPALSGTPAQPETPALETPAPPAEPGAPRQSAPKQPAQHRPATQQQPLKHPVQQQPANQPPAQAKQRKKAA